MGIKKGKMKMKKKLNELTEIIKNIGSLIIKYRWLLALCVFVFCVALKIHGTSIGVYDVIFPTKISEDAAQKYNVAGHFQPVRGDELAVHTPTYFSQYYNGYKKYSHQMSVGKTNMILDYYAPVKDITVLCKPFNIGYILFGNERGLSFYWCSQMIMLFMAAFEMFYILTKKDSLLSIVGMCMIGFSPAMQWWMIPHMPIVFIYAMILFDLGYYMFTYKNKKMQWLFAVMEGFLAVGFALSIFPSCQIVTGLVAVVLLVVCLIRDRTECGIVEGMDKNEIKKNIINAVIKAAVAGTIAIGILLWFVITSREDLRLLTNTVYPGKRVVLGHNATLKDLFTELRSLTLAFRDTNILNNSEIATFIHFTPLFLVIFPSLARRLRNEKNNKKNMDLLVGKALFISLLVEIAFMGLGFSPRLAKLTLFSYVNRMQMGYGFTGVIFNVWCIDMLWKQKAMYKKWQLILLPVIYAITYEMMITIDLREYLRERYLCIEIVIMSVIVAFAIMKYKKLFALGMCSVMIFAGAFVNPICRGIAPITNHPISRFINETSRKDPNSYWIVADESVQIANFAMANGAKSLTSTNFYPDYAKWNVLDKSGKKEEVYNRYLNHSMLLTNGKTNMHILTPDSVRVNVNPKDLLKLNVKYVMTKPQNEKILKKANIRYKKLFYEDGYAIYKIEK